MDRFREAWDCAVGLKCCLNDASNALLSWVHFAFAVTVLYLPPLNGHICLNNTFEISMTLTVVHIY